MNLRRLYTSHLQVGKFSEKTGNELIPVIPTEDIDKAVQQVKENIKGLRFHASDMRNKLLQQVVIDQIEEEFK